MPWIQLKLNTTGANAEDLSDALMEAGAVSITFQDTHDTPVFEPLPGETRLWGDTDARNVEPLSCSFLILISSWLTVSLPSPIGRTPRSIQRSISDLCALPAPILSRPAGCNYPGHTKGRPFTPNGLPFFYAGLP